MLRAVPLVGKIARLVAFLSRDQRVLTALNTS